jgi:hypothetical protein
MIRRRRNAAFRKLDSPVASAIEREGGRQWRRLCGPSLRRLKISIELYFGDFSAMSFGGFDPPCCCVRMLGNCSLLEM